MSWKGSGCPSPEDLAPGCGAEWGAGRCSDRGTRRGAAVIRSGTDLVIDHHLRHDIEISLGNRDGSRSGRPDGRSRSKFGPLSETDLDPDPRPPFGYEICLGSLRLVPEARSLSVPRARPGRASVPDQPREERVRSPGRPRSGPRPSGRGVDPHRRTEAWSSGLTPRPFLSCLRRRSSSSVSNLNPDASWASCNSSFCCL